MATAIAALSTTQRRVLAAVKRLDEVTADELAEALEISASAARQHLSALRSAGFVEARQDRGQPGRPADRYHATLLTEPLFVASDANLSVELLGHMQDEDPELVDRVFERRRQQLAADAKQRLADKPIGERIDALTELLDAQGYLADFEHVDQGHYRIKLHNCAMWEVASHYKQACTSELAFIQDLIPDATVRRVTHKTAGAHSCAYEISIGS